MKCHDCARPVRLRADGTRPSRCKTCASERAARARARRLAALDAGLCAYPGGCSEPVAERDGATLTMCEPHLQMWRAARVRRAES